MDEAEKLFETVKKSSFINLLMKDVAEKAYQQGYKDAINDFYNALTQERCECCKAMRDKCANGDVCFIKLIADDLERKI